MGGGLLDLRSLSQSFLFMFNFSANHLFLLSRTEHPSYAVFLLQDRDTQRVYRLYDFSKAQCMQPDVDLIEEIGSLLIERPKALVPYRS